MLDIIRGATTKENSTAQLIEGLERLFTDPDKTEGLAYIGYPILNTAIGGITLDAVLVTESHGMVVFDLIEGTESENRAQERDKIFASTKSRLIQYAELRDKRDLGVSLNVFTFAPQVRHSVDHSEEYITSDEALTAALSPVADADKNADFYVHLIAVVQAVTKLATQRKRHVVKSDSRGAKLKAIEASIANLDSRQSRAVIETVDGPQRLRGLAGSGKTVILALKAAYLHSRYPEWDIAVTFNTRSLKEQFIELVTKFTIEQKSEDPDWEKIKIIQSWGSHSSPGIYYEFCLANGIEPLDFRTAKSQSMKHLTPLGYVSLKALNQLKDKNVAATPLYDAILIDEAQDLSQAFLKLCYAFLKPPKRLIWAYDELQNLSMVMMKTPHQLFGINLSNESGSAQQDIILDRCYRNSRPVLVAAHGLGFGTARSDGLVQMFDDPSLWEEIGYEVESGELSAGSEVVLSRPTITSPPFLEAHSPLDDLIQFRTFQNAKQQSEWVASEIEKNLTEDELTTRDIVVITLNAITAEADTSLLRVELLKRNIEAHLAGVTTSADQFFKDGSVAITGIYRAKGNEAAMVYVMNSEYVFTGPELIKKRNILFSAITRSKAWVRVVGCGPNMKALTQEFEKIRDSGFKLSFIYPSKEQMEQLRIINRDLTDTEKRRRKSSLDDARKLALELQKGTIKLDELDVQTRDQLRLFLSGKKDEQNRK